MRLELETIKVAQPTYNTYVDVGSITLNGKRAVSRTKSEPITSSKIQVNYRAFRQSGLNWPEPVNMFPSSRNGKPSKAQDQLASGRLYMVMQSSGEYCQASKALKKTLCTSNVGMSNDEATTIEESQNPYKRSRKRSLSITEGEFDKNRFSTSFETPNRKNIHESVNGSKGQIFALSNDREHMIREKVSTSVITTQPQPATQNECMSSSEIPNKDICFRCLKTVKNMVNCCTCLWCFDACCYHSFKDDVGYTSWFTEMLSCNKSPAENAQQWSLLGLATVVFPCILLYPILGGAVNQCIKCRLADYNKKY